MMRNATTAAPTLWGAAVTTTYPPLATDTMADVVVIGAGIAGVSIAWELANNGHQVVVLDQGRVGHGVTGHSTGKVSVLQGTLFSELEKSHGGRTSALYAQTQLLAMQHLVGLVERIGIDCSLRRRPAFLFAETTEGVDRVKQEVAAVRRSGLDLRFTLETGLPFPIVGSARMDNQLEFDPLAYVQGLAADLARKGGCVHEHSAVVELTEGSPHTIRTTDGYRVRAQHVVVATHFPIFDRSLLFPRLHPRREFVLAGRRAAGVDKLPGMYLAISDDVRSVRTTAKDDLVVTGAPFTPGATGSSVRRETLRQWSDARFPGTEWTHEWAAQDNDTPDGLPFIGPLRPFGKQVWVATGFGGWGLTNGVLAGTLVRDLVEGRESEFAPLFHTRRIDPVSEAKSLLRGSTRVANNWVATRARARVEQVDSVADLAVDQAGYLGDGGWAAYRDVDGQAHVVCSACSHQGCLLGFNDAERTWECPCHGSRFSVDGDVLQGPATTPLERRDDT